VKKLEKQNPQAARELMARTGGGHFGMQARLDIYRPPKHEVTRAIHALRRSPGPKQVVDLWDIYKNAVFHGNNKIERLGAYAAIGKEAQRDVQAATGAWHKALSLGGKAYDDAAHGLVGTEKQIQYAKAVDDLRGRYSKFSPAAREFITSYTPFAPWYANALYFVFVTLPVKHPIKTGALASSFQAVRADLEAQGLSHFLPEDQRLPGFLQGSVKKGDGRLNLQRYVPFGAFSDPLGTAGDMVLPQVSSTILNLGGVNWQLRKLRNQQGEEPMMDERALIALNTLAESFTPFLRHTRQIREKGGSPQDTSTVLRPRTREGTSTSYGAGARRAFDPFRPTSPGGGGKTKKVSLREQLTGEAPKKKSLREELLGESKKRTSLREQLLGTE
jgi:hypothetical protein